MIEEVLQIDKVWFLLVAALAVEAATNLMTKSEFASMLYKKWLFKHRKNWLCGFLHDLLDCGYCTSVWVSIPPAIWYAGNNNIVEWVLFTLIIHRLSNIIHFSIDWLDEKRTRDFDFNSKGEDDYERLREEHDTPVVAHDEENSGPRREDSSE
jgi:hypothetical protein